MLSITFAYTYGCGCFTFSYFKGCFKRKSVLMSCPLNYRPKKGDYNTCFPGDLQSCSEGKQLPLRLSVQGLGRYQQGFYSRSVTSRFTNVQYVRANNLRYNSVQNMAPHATLSLNNETKLLRACAGSKVVTCASVWRDGRMSAPSPMAQSSSAVVSFS
jgi:hypothetical protein